MQSKRNEYLILLTNNEVELVPDYWKFKPCSGHWDQSKFKFGPGN